MVIVELAMQFKSQNKVNCLSSSLKVEILLLYVPKQNKSELISE